MVRYKFYIVLYCIVLYCHNQLFIYKKLNVNIFVLTGHHAGIHTPMEPVSRPCYKVLQMLQILRASL